MKEFARERMLVERLPLVDECKGCQKAEEVNNVCSNFIDPKAMWRRGNCNMATNIIIEEKKTGKIRVGQQKHKKKH